MRRIYCKLNSPWCVEDEWDKCQYNDRLPHSIITGFGSAGGFFQSQKDGCYELAWVQVLEGQISLAGDGVGRNARRDYLQKCLHAASNIDGLLYKPLESHGVIGWPVANEAQDSAPGS